MRDDLVVSGSVEINASIAEVWNGLTDPKVIKEYLFGTETITDWKIGSGIIFQGEYQGQKYKDKGIVKDFRLNKTISYRYWSAFTGLEDKPENYSLVTYDVERLSDNLTRLTWTQQGFANEEGYKHSESGIQQLLLNIKEVIEKQEN